MSDASFLVWGAAPALLRVGFRGRPSIAPAQRDSLGWVVALTSLVIGYLFAVRKPGGRGRGGPTFALLVVIALVQLPTRLYAIEVESPDAPPHTPGLGASPAHSSPAAEIAGGGQRVALAKKPNVFLLNIDMLRADHLGIHGYSRNTTPVLDRIAREGIWFQAARSHAPWTYPSVVSLLSGMYPTSHGATYSGAQDTYVTTTVPEGLETLATVLDDTGYATAAFITNPLLKRSSGLDRGFDVFQDEFIGEWKRLSAGRWWGASMAAERVHEAVLDWLDTSPEPPLFAYIHYIDVHGPYLQPLPFGGSPGSVEPADAERARLTGKPRQLAIDLYDGALARLDGLIGGFLSALEERGVLANSVVIITSDHGEEFGEHAGHGHGHTLYEEMLHVPLIVMRTAAIPYSRVIDTPVAQVDILPTVAALAGADAPPGVAGKSLAKVIIEGADVSPQAILSEMDNRGRPVWNAKKGDPEVSYALLLPPATKYVVGLDVPLGPESVPDQERFFDLAADPGENEVVAEPPAQQVGLAQGQLRAVLERARSVAMQPGTAVIDDATRERLRVLGYIPDPASEGE